MATPSRSQRDDGSSTDAIVQMLGVAMASRKDEWLAEAATSTSV